MDSKNMKRLFVLAVSAVTAAVSCQKDVTTDISGGESELYAVIEDSASTRTYMDEGKNVRWSEGDQVVAFMRTTLGLAYQIKPAYVGRTYGYFSKVSSGASDDLGMGMELDHNVIYYPYADETEIYKSGPAYALDVVLPSEQNYLAESFASGSFPMVAVSEDNNIAFKNICGGMKLQLKGTQRVASITVQGNDFENLSGPATVTAYADGKKPEISMAYRASKIVTLNCGAVQLSEKSITDFMITLPPVVFSKGFTVVVTGTDGATSVISTDKVNEIQRSSILVMPEITLPETREVFYIDEYGIDHGPGVRIGKSIWAPVNCGYHATDHPWGKLYQWGRKYGQGHYDSVNLQQGGVAVSIAQDKKNQNVFFLGNPDNNDSWVYPLDDSLWNGGTDSDPIKTEHDPCPAGWRVPSYEELDDLRQNKRWATNELCQSGYWFSGASPYTEASPQIFLPAAGFRYSRNGDVLGFNNDGNYWSSAPYSDTGVYRLYFYEGFTNLSVDSYATGCSVRCVQE